MRIVWLSQFVPHPPTSGALERSYHLLRHAARSHEVHLVALDQYRLREGAVSVEESVTVLRGFCASVQVCPMPFERSRVRRGLAMALSVSVNVPYDRIWLHSRAMHGAAEALTAHAAPDLVHVDTIGLMLYARHFPRARVVLNHHNIESGLTARRALRETSRLRTALLQREARQEQRAEREICPKVGANLVVSALDGQRLREVAPGASVYVVENGVNTSYFAPAADPGPEGGLVFVGTLGWYANREAARFLVSELVPALKARGLAHRLTLVGRDPRRDDWGGADAAVTATDYVPDIRPFLRDSCIFVCPIRDGGGTRLKVLAALAMAKPLVATPLAVEGLRLVEGQHYLRAESLGEFVDQVGRLEADSALRHRLGDAGRALVEREYDWSVVGRQLDAAYAETAARERAAW